MNTEVKEKRIHKTITLSKQACILVNDYRNKTDRFLNFSATIDRIIKEHSALTEENK